MKVLDRLLRWAAPRKALLLELFVAVNLAFLVADIYVAHSVNAFREWSEWIPFWYSAVGAVLLGGNLAAAGLSARRGGAGDARRPGRSFHMGFGRWLGFVVGGAGILVGVLGLVLHLESYFFQELTLKSLVYSAPFIAPLAFAGLGFLAILNRMVEHHSTEWAGWVVFMTLGGFVGNFAVSLTDHAQNGFFYAEEWIPVASAALAVGWLTVVMTGRAGRQFVRWGFAVMALQVVVGLLGEWLHLQPLLTESGGALFDRLIYGAPIFPPLLFCNLAVLGALGLWALLDRMEEPA